MTPWLNRSDRYFLRQFLGTFFFVLGIFLVVAIVFDISEKIDEFLTNKPGLKAIVFDYYLHFIPFYAGLLSPLLLFIGVIYFTSRLAYRSEIIALMAGGTPVKRLLRPYMIGAGVLGGLMLWFNGWIIPRSNEKKQDFEARFLNKTEHINTRNLHVQTGQGQFVYMQSFQPSTQVGYLFSIEQFNGVELKSKLMADRAEYDSAKGAWTLNRYSIRYINGIEESMEFGLKKDTNINLKPQDLTRKDEEVQTMTLSEINVALGSEKTLSLGNARIYRVERLKRWSMPITGFILTLIGFSLASKKVRGGTGVHLGIGIATAFVFLLCFHFSTTFAIKGTLSPVLALLIPNLLFGLLSVYFYVRASR